MHDPLQAAAAWHVRLSAGDSPADREAWQAWHDEAPEHRAAWQRVERLQELLAQAPAGCTQVLQRTGRHGRPARRALIGGLGALALAAVSYPWLPWFGAAPVDWVATGAGEQRELTLPDGTQVLLAPLSRVGLQDGRRARTLQLTQGSLQVQTAPGGHDKPLSVQTPHGSVRPLGTRFSVTLAAQHTLVAVREQAVEVLPNGAALPVRVSAGQRALFTAAGVEPPIAIDGSEDAWARGMLLALDQPLASFLQALQQQSGVTLSCDPAVAGLRVSGSFLARDPQRSLATLAAQHGLKLMPRGAGWHLAAR